MESTDVLGAVLVVVGLGMLYLLRGVLVSIIILVLGFVGVVIGAALVVGGLAMIFWSRRWW